MKEKILALFKTKYPAVNLSKKRLDALAAKLEPKITDESQIGAQLDALNDAHPFSEIAADDDRLRNLETQLAAAKNPKKEKEEEETPAEAAARKKKEKEEESSEQMPAWAKRIEESNKKLSDSFAALQTEKLQGSIRDTVKAKVAEIKGKKIPDSHWSEWTLPAKPEDVDAFVTKIETHYDGYLKDLNTAGMELHPKAGGGSGAGPVNTAAPDQKEVDAIVKNIM